MEEEVDIEFGGSLLLGNGFSVAHSKDYSYDSLFEFARNRYFMGKDLDYFDATKNFETAIEKARQNNDHGAAGRLRIALAKAVFYKSEEARDQNSLDTRKFLRNFSQIFTLCYDLIPYYNILKICNEARNKSRQSGNEFITDGFARISDKMKILGAAPWSEDNYESSSGKEFRKLFFLHGALHLRASDNGSVIRLQAWKDDADADRQQLRESIESSLRNNVPPLFVCEGNAGDKLTMIRQSPYLNHCYEKLMGTRGNLTIFGASLSESDQHMVDAIIRSQFERIYIGIREPDEAKIAAVAQKFEDYQQPKFWFNSDLAGIG